MSRVLVVLLVLFATTATATAQEDVLRAVDELTAANRCEAALALLAHATGTPAEIAGRRGLCEAALGRSAEAASHIGEALQSPADPWVAANRARMLAALSAGPAQAPVVEPAPVVAPVVAEPASVPVVEIASADTSIDGDFVRRFGTDVPEDRPRDRQPFAVRGSRFVLRATAGLGFVRADPLWLDHDSRLYEYSSGDPNEIGSYEHSYGISYRDVGQSLRMDVGVEAEQIVTGRFSLLVGLELGLAPGMLTEGGAYSQIRLTDGFDRYDNASGEIDWGVTFGLRATAGVRFYLGGGRVILGTAFRVGLVRTHGRAELLDSDFDADNRRAGTKEGEFEAWMGGATLENTVEIGLGLGARRDILVLARAGFGVPIVTTQVVVLVPIFRSQP